MSDGSSAEKPAGASRPRRPFLRTLVVWIGVGLALLLIVGSATVYGYYRDLRDNMVQHDLNTTLVEEERPPKIGDDLNILMIGSDGREGGNAAYGGRDFVGERSDSLMLVHISPDRDNVTVVNFPRDSLVDLPECDPYGDTEGTGPYHGMLNAALFHGGPPCVVKAVESLTDIRIDHFVHVSFVGFRETVEAIGGVEICIPKPLQDERAKLDLEEGTQTLSGEEALAFVRARYEIGDGGDIGRIDRQQMFLGAMADEVLSSEMLTDPGRLMSVLDAVSRHTATDSDLTLEKMVSIGTTISGVDERDIMFYTVPWWQAPSNPNRIVWNEEKAALLFEAIREDARLYDADLRSSPKASPSDWESAPAAESPSPEESAQRSPTEDTGSEETDETIDADGIEGRDATSNPCVHGLGKGTSQDGE